MRFQDQLVAFNEMYGLPVNTAPTNLGTQRLKDLKEILLKEVNEIDEIISQSEMLDGVRKLAAQALEDGVPFNHVNAVDMAQQILVGVADLMGDLQVYCGSEMAKWGIPMEAVQYIIMASNMSKLGADGQPIINGQGKVEKGPYYWKPEPLINNLLVHMGSGQWNSAMQIAHNLVAAKRAELQHVG